MGALWYSGPISALLTNMPILKFVTPKRKYWILGVTVQGIKIENLHQNPVILIKFNITVEEV